jgi:hypothetical protein
MGLVHAGCAVYIYEMRLKAGFSIGTSHALSEYNRRYDAEVSSRNLTPRLKKVWRPFAVWALGLMLVLASGSSSFAALIFREVQG